MVSARASRLKSLTCSLPTKAQRRGDPRSAPIAWIEPSVANHSITLEPAWATNRSYVSASLHPAMSNGLLDRLTKMLAGNLANSNSKSPAAVLRPTLFRFWRLVEGGLRHQELIWASRNDTFVDASRLTKELNRLAPLAGISRHVRPHDLRHTHPSHLAASGVDPVTIRKRMGWSSIKLLDEYAGRWPLGIKALSQPSTRSLASLQSRPRWYGCGPPRPLSPETVTVEDAMERVRATKERLRLEAEGVYDDIPFSSPIGRLSRRADTSNRCLRSFIYCSSDG